MTKANELGTELIVVMLTDVYMEMSSSSLSFREKEREREFLIRSFITIKMFSLILAQSLENLFSSGLSPIITKPTNSSAKTKGEGVFKGIWSVLFLMAFLLFTF